MKRQCSGWQVKRLRGGGLVVLSALCVLMTGGVNASADDPSTAGDKAEIEMLKARLERLEQRVAERDSVARAGGDVSTGDKPSLATLQLPSGMSSVQMSGFVDTSYIYNFHNPDSGTPGRTNRGRVFDVNPNGFTIQAAELTLEKALSDESPLGFRTDLYFGDDAELIHSTGLPTLAASTTEAFDLQQAYVTARAPIGSGLDFKVGKFVTLLGAEVIESPANWNFSRSYLFGYAIPFTHTGALASYALGDLGSVTAGVVNGWDIVDDNNSGKDFIGNITLTPIQNVTLAVNGITGPQRASDDRNGRSVIDLVATVTPIEHLSLMANYDYGHESSMSHGVAGTAGFDSSNWQGLALYAKYDVTPKFALAGRWEWFDDKDNVRVALTGPGTTTLGGIDYTEFTLTSQYTFHEHLLGRLEYRHDKADERVFFHGDGGFLTAQDTIAVEMVAHF